MALHRYSKPPLAGVFFVLTSIAALLPTHSVLAIETGPGISGQKCADGTPPDNVTRVFGGGLCLAAITHVPAQASDATPVVVFLHGDGGGRTGETYRARVAANLANKMHVIAVAILRPGYSDGKVKSDGYARPGDDDYRRPTIDVIAGVIDSLRAYYPRRKLIVTGHSGGAAISALIMGIYPGKADGAVLVACPCDVPRWRDWRNSSAGKSGIWLSLSPLSHAPSVSKSATVIAVTGDKDDNTLPKFAMAYVDALKKAGIRHAEFMTAPGMSHNRSIDSPAYHEAVSKVMALVADTGSAGTR